MNQVSNPETEDSNTNEAKLIIWVMSHMDVEPKIWGKPPKWMVKIMVDKREKLIKIDDLGGTIHFWKHPCIPFKFDRNNKKNNKKTLQIYYPILNVFDKHEGFPE